MEGSVTCFPGACSYVQHKGCIDRRTVLIAFVCRWAPPARGGVRARFAMASKLEHTKRKTCISGVLNFRQASLRRRLVSIAMRFEDEEQQVRFNCEIAS